MFYWIILVGGNKELRSAYSEWVEIVKYFMVQFCVHVYLIFSSICFSLFLSLKYEILLMTVGHVLTNILFNLKCDLHNILKRFQPFHSSRFQ